MVQVSAELTSNYTPSLAILSLELTLAGMSLQVPIPGSKSMLLVCYNAFNVTSGNATLRVRA
jgi:hypothetical protein